MPKQVAKCYHCKVKFSFQPGVRTGKYCSQACHLAFRRVEKDKIIRAGLAGHGATKRYLIRTLGNRCAHCGLGPRWNGKPLTLQMNHKDGNSDNNKPRNCELICPNCHTQTETFGSKGTGNRYRKMAKRNVNLRIHKGYA